MGNKNIINKSKLSNIKNDEFIKSLKTLSKQITKNIIRIKYNSALKIGFFCKIPYPEENSTLPVLITSYLSIEENMSQKNQIEISLLNHEFKREILIDITRKVYSNKIYDITIIEVEKRDNLDINSFLEIDLDFYKEEIYKSIKKNSIYLICYLNESNFEYSPGYIKNNIKADFFDIISLNNKEKIVLDSPIINLTDNKIIGIGKRKTGKNSNKGFFIKNIINEFNDEINIIYKNVYSDTILFGYEFVKYNKNICKIRFNGNDHDLSSLYQESFNIKLINNLFKIKLKGVKNITNISYMFNECSSLYSIPDIIIWNTKKVTDMKYLFCGCKSLQSLPDISNWDTKNVVDMSNIFSGCQSLISLPDISNWDTKKVIDMSYLFKGCKNLLYLPDISKWNINNVKGTEGMFYNCRNLSFIPDISRWNTNNVMNMNNLFLGCKSLILLPKISKWNITNLNDMSYLFFGCISLAYTPNLIKNTVKKVKMLDGCLSNINIGN